MSIFVHPQALCESDEVGDGTRVWAFAHVMSGARVGRDCNICGGAFVESGVEIGERVTVKNNVLLWDGCSVEDDVFLGPNVVFTNDPRPRVEYKIEPSNFAATRVEKGASIGAGAVIVAPCRIGSYALVGAGAVVVADVESHALVVGNPARQVGWVCECGTTLPDDLACGCGRSYREAEGGLTPRG